MEKALIVSSDKNAGTVLNEALIKMNLSSVTIAYSGNEARILVAERDFDLCIINMPLKDESGIRLAQDISLTTCQVILIVKTEYWDEISAKVEETGVFCLAKPINYQMLWNALKLAGASHYKLLNMHRQNTELKTKLEDIKQISRAKCLLISTLNMSEQQAHRYIEKQAMDLRKTRIEIAKEIIDNYEKK